jgi:hypothetical protein
VKANLSNISGKLDRLERQALFVRLLGWLLCIAASAWLAGMIWDKLPIEVRNKLTDEAVKWMFGALLVFLAILRKGGKK